MEFYFQRLASNLSKRQGTGFAMREVQFTPLNLSQSSVYNPKLLFGLTYNPKLYKPFTIAPF